MNGNGSIRAWRMYVTQHRLIVAIVGGLVATHVTTNTGMWYHGIGLPDLNFNLLNGYLVLGNSGMDPKGINDPVMLTLFGGLAHYAMGVSLSLIYAFGIYPLLPIASSMAGNFAKGLIWGLIMATLSAVWWINLFPNLAGPGRNAGIFMVNLADSWKWVVAVYLWHIVYGFHLGAFYQPLSEASPASD